MTETVSPRLLPGEVLEQAAECLRTIAHPARLQLIRLLLRERNTVGALAELCDLAPNVTSEHLRLMERCNLLQRERDGRKVYYAVSEPQLAHIIDCIEQRFLQGEN